jgi:glycosyltransferase involved in cell wall biosynthesis
VGLIAAAREAFPIPFWFLPAHFLGYQDDTTLPALYASSDLFVFPSETDTLGQVVIEAQAAGVPVLVSDKGGPQEVMDDGITGLVLPVHDPADWETEINQLLDDTPRRQRMGRTASQRMARFSTAKAFDVFWDTHLEIANLQKTANPSKQMQNS